MPNHGDVALKLPADWSRTMLASGHEFMTTCVGHENGVADSRLKEDPNAEHQFAWCDPKDVDRFHMLRSKHYEWVKNDKWEKNELLWEWDAEGFTLYKGQRLMARAASFYHAEEAEKKRARDEEANLRKMRRSRLDESDDYAARRLGAQGARVFDEDDRELKPLKKAARG